VCFLFKRKEACHCGKGSFFTVRFESRPHLLSLLLLPHRYALQHGYALTPCYCFGEKETYGNLQGWWGPRFWLNGQGLPAIVPFGKWWSPLLPRAERLHIVVGKALQLPCVASPSDADVAKWHAEYVGSLVALFDRHKASYGEADAKLEVW